MKATTQAMGGNGRFAGLVTKLESSRALAEHNIQQIKKSAVKVSTHLGVVRFRLHKLSQREQELKGFIRRWRQHTVAYSELDQKKALQCVQALSKSQELLDVICAQLSLDSQLEQDLSAYLREIQQKLNQLEQQRERPSAEESISAV